jgi:hypothetical protein
MPKSLCALAPAILVLACAAPQDIASQTATLQGYCNTRATTECTAQVVASCQVKDVATCVTQRSATCIANVPQGTVYVPAAAPACIQAVATAYATTTITAASIATMATVCEPVFSGPGAARAPCTVDYDCSTADGLRCLVPYGEMQGKCLAPNVVQPAAPCPGEADVCPDAYYCDPTSLVCVAQVPAGTQCDPRYPSCLPGSVCPNAIFATSCEPLAAAGSACMADTDCASNLCDKATGQAQGVCADQVQLTALDSMCSVYQ